MCKVLRLNKSLIFYFYSLIFTLHAKKNLQYKVTLRLQITTVPKSLDQVISSSCNSRGTLTPSLAGVVKYPPTCVLECPVDVQIPLQHPDE